MKILVLIALANATIGWLDAQPNPVSPPEKRLALVIGNGSYTQRSAVPQALNNADDLATLLPKLGFEVMLFKNVDRINMQLAIHRFSAKLKGYQVGLVYYAGQGVGLDGKQFLLPIDANPTTATDVDELCLRTSQLITDMASAKATTNLILLDTGRDNPFTRTYTRGSGFEFDEPLGFIIAYATAPGKPTVNIDGRNSLYTAALLQALSVPDQSVLQVLKRIRDDVLQRSGHKQIPWESTSLTGDFYFQRK